MRRTATAGGDRDGGDGAPVGLGEEDVAGERLGGVERGEARDRPRVDRARRADGQGGGGAHVHHDRPIDVEVRFDLLG
jgi:hypothetical protein